MAKELPYFKFYTSDWSNGDITLETYELQGLFINICAYYWSKDGDLSLSVLLKKFRGHDDNIEQLREANIIKINDGFVSISFLNEQMESKQLQKYINQKNGSKGGRPKKKKTEKKPNGFIQETEVEANVNPKQTNIDYSKVDNSKVDNRREEVKENFSPSEIDLVLTKKIMDWFGFSETTNFDKFRKVVDFQKCLEAQNKIEYFKTQFSAYSELKTLDPKFKHHFLNFLGKQGELFLDGIWNAENWTQKLIDEKHKSSPKIVDQPKSKFEKLKETFENSQNPYENGNPIVY